MNNIIEMLLNHSSVRRFKEQLVSPEIVDLIVKSAQMSPSSSNFQAYTIIEVQNPEKKKFLSQVSGDQEWVVKAPLVFLFCGDISRGMNYFEGIEDKEVFRNTESFIVATVDTALAAQKAFIAAQSMGLGGVFIGGIRNDIEKVADEFKLPDLVFPLFALCFGYPEEIPGIKPRLPKDVIHKIDFYDDSKDPALIEAYNEVTSNYYLERNNGKSDESWTKRSGRALMAKPRYNVGYYIREKGLCK